MSEQMMLDINRLAILQDRTIAELLYLWVSDRAYGECVRRRPGQEAPEKASDGQ